MQLGKIRLPDFLGGKLQLLQGKRIGLPGIFRKWKYPQEISSCRKVFPADALAPFPPGKLQALKAAVQKLRPVLAVLVVGFQGNGNIRHAVQPKDVILFFISLRQAVGKTAREAYKAGIFAFQDRLLSGLFRPPPLSCLPDGSCSLRQRRGKVLEGQCADQRCCCSDFYFVPYIRSFHTPPPSEHHLQTLYQKHVIFPGCSHPKENRICS